MVTSSNFTATKEVSCVVLTLEDDEAQALYRVITDVPFSDDTRAEEVLTNIEAALRDFFNSKK